ncbi:MAG: hypothetical protein QHH75_07955 [Bacillota bacterium]|nr:hypothetical protein [Bacillota bacterium]
MITAGIDIGSLTTEAVLLCEKGILAYSIVNTGSQARRAAEQAFEEVLEKASPFPGRSPTANRAERE